MNYTMRAAPETCRFFPPTISARNIRIKKLPKSNIVCFCDVPKDDNGQSEGDKRRQEILARIAMLQTQKVRLTDYLDERSAYLTKFAEDANTEFDQIGETALKDLDEATARIMAKLEGRMQTFEEKAEVNRQDIEKGEKELEEFEDKIERDRNEGLFFKNLREIKQKPEEYETSTVKAEAEKIKKITKESAGSETRRKVYLGLMGLVGVGIVNSVLVLVVSGEVELKRLLAFVLIFVALLAQYVYEINISSSADNNE